MNGPQSIARITGGYQATLGWTWAKICIYFATLMGVVLVTIRQGHSRIQPPRVGKWNQEPIHHFEAANTSQYLTLWYTNVTVEIHHL